jgi:hypothetical protein
MKKITLLLACVLFLAECHNTEPTGKRVFLAQGNVSLILPDSSLKYDKMKMIEISLPRDYGEYDELFFSPDTSIALTIYSRADPVAPQNLPWKVYFNEKRIRSELLVKSCGTAAIEKIVGDSTTRTIETDTHLQLRGRLSYTKEITVYGKYRRIRFWFSVPDNAEKREAVANSCRSIVIKREYLAEVVKPYRDYAHSL